MKLVISHKLRGLSLVELLIAMVLGLLLTAGIFTLFVNSRAAYATQAGLAEMQEQARFVLEDIARSVRSAGFTGCARGDNEVEYVTNSEATHHRRGFDRRIDGYNGTANGHEPAIRDGFGSNAIVSDIKPGTDVLVLRTVEDGNVFLAATMASPTAPLTVTAGKVGDENDKREVTNGDVVAITDCLNSTVFQVRGIDVAANELRHDAGGGGPGNTTGNFVKAYDAGAQLFRIDTVSYLVREQSGEPPSLWKKIERGQGDNNALGGGFQEVIEGVEQLQILFGQDIDDDRVADEYVTANNVTGEIVTVRVSLMLQSLDELPVDTDTRAITVGDVEIPAANDRHLRRVFTKTISVRNQLP